MSTTRVLIVEHDPALLRLAAALLSPRYEVAAVASLERAMQYLAENDCQIMLVDLERAGDVSWIARARELRPGLRCGVTTAGGLAAEQQDRLREADAWVLEKPYRARALQRAVAGALRQRM